MCHRSVNPLNRESQIQLRDQQMPNNGMENAAIEETLHITFEHLKLHNVKEIKVC